MRRCLSFKLRVGLENFELVLRQSRKVGAKVRNAFVVRCMLLLPYLCQQISMMRHLLAI
ncbi:hypothetical protein IC582_015134 [Cucumis melo]